MIPDPDEIISQLKSMANPANTAGMARYGINVEYALGVSMPALRRMARGLHGHSLALALWQSGIHEARILAALVDRPAEVTEAQMESWALDFDSWDVCDQVCSNLFSYTPLAVKKIHDWVSRPEEYVKRAGFVLMAALAVHDKKACDQVFLDFLPLIQREATDSRNFVKKAVNWALRQVGKRNLVLRSAAVEAGRQIAAIDSPSARWIARDALRELESQ